MSSSRPAPNLAQGRRLQRIGGAVFWPGLVGAVLATGSQSLWEQWFSHSWLISPLLFLVAGFGAAIMRRGRKLAAPTGEQQLESDPRPPVVYLRPFAADPQGAGLRLGHFTDEEQLASVLNEIGPFVAIGDPDETLPDLGAARIYASAAEWQRAVIELLAKAKLVVLRAGTSEGFWWELRQVKQLVQPQRVLLLVPSGAAEYEAFRRRAADVLPEPLPDLPRMGRVMSRTRAIITFEAGWRPRILPLVRSFARTPFTKPYLARTKLTLRPVFERLGIAWSPPPVARPKMIVSFAGAAVGGPLALLLIGMFAENARSGQMASAPASSREITLAVDAYDASFQRWNARMDALPGFRARVAGAKDSADARAIGRELSARGVRRLSDQSLIRRTDLMFRILSEADVSTCGAIVKGDPSQRIEPLLRRLFPQEIDQYFEILFEAAVAELHETPMPAIADSVSQGLLQQLLDGMAPADSQSVLGMIVNPRGGSLEEACRAGRLLYENLARMPPQAHATLMRALLEP